MDPIGSTVPKYSCVLGPTRHFFARCILDRGDISRPHSPLLLPPIQPLSRNRGATALGTRTPRDRGCSHPILRVKNRRSRNVHVVNNIRNCPLSDSAEVRGDAYVIYFCVCEALTQRKTVKPVHVRPPSAAAAARASPAEVVEGKKKALRRAVFARAQQTGDRPS